MRRARRGRARRCGPAACARPWRRGVCRSGERKYRNSEHSAVSASVSKFERPRERVGEEGSVLFRASSVVAKVLAFWLQELPTYLSGCLTGGRRSYLPTYQLPTMHARGTYLPAESQSIEPHSSSYIIPKYNS